MHHFYILLWEWMFLPLCWSSRDPAASRRNHHSIPFFRQGQPHLQKLSLPIGIVFCFIWKQDVSQESSSECLWHVAVILHLPRQNKPCSAHDSAHKETPQNKQVHEVFSNFNFTPKNYCRVQRFNSPLTSSLNLTIH